MSLDRLPEIAITPDPALAEKAKAEKLKLIQELASKYIPKRDLHAEALAKSGTKAELPDWLKDEPGVEDAAAESLSKKAAGELSDDWKDWIEGEEFGDNYARDEIYRYFGEAPIPSEELPTYVEEAFAFERELAQMDIEGRSPVQDAQYRINTIVQASQSLEAIKFWREAFKEWSALFAEGEDKDVRKKKSVDFKSFVGELSGAGRSPRPEPRSFEEIKKQFAVYKEIKEFLYSSPEKSAYINQERYLRNPVGVFEDSFLKIAADSHDPEQARIFFQIFKDCIGSAKDQELLSKYLDIVKTYGRTHNITDAARVGFRDKLLPALENKDPQVDVLQTSGNRWGMHRGDFGIADFACHAYAVEVNPQRVNELMMALRELPTTSVARLEQNRKDALSLMPSFAGLRDFIHDQRPLVREVLRAMVKYYETHDKKELEVLLNSTEGYLKGQRAQELIFDLAGYEKEIQVTVGGIKKQEKAIDTLKRVVSNTEILDEAPPVTSDASLNQALIDVQQNSTSKEKLQTALDQLNDMLLGAMEAGQIGIEPNFILAITWLERKAFTIMQDLNYEDQQGVYRAPWFQAVIKFQELTNSARPFDQKEFDDFMGKIFATREPREAFRMISARILQNLSELAKIYKQAGKPHITGALWSGNIAHEFISLTDFRPATTTYGERHKKEMEKPAYLRNTGD